MILDNQRWRFNGSFTLESKAEIWKSNSTWKKQDEEDGKYIIKNVSKGKFLTRSGKLTSNEQKAQIWREVNKDNEGYFTLEAYTTAEERKKRSTGNPVLTASPNQLTLEGELFTSG